MHTGDTASRGNGLFTPNDPEIYEICKQYGVKNDQGNYGVEYKNGIPDFSPYAMAQVEISNMTTDRYSKNGNFKQADIELAKQWNCKPEQVKKWRTDNGYTWHELNDVKTMQLVPAKINNTFIHIGGTSESKDYKP